MSNVLSPLYYTNVKLGTLKQVFEEPPQQDFIARSIHFIEKGHAIIVCYLESHEM